MSVLGLRGAPIQTEAVVWQLKHVVTKDGSKNRRQDLQLGRVAARFVLLLLPVCSGPE